MQLLADFIYLLDTVSASYQAGPFSCLRKCRSMQTCLFTTEVCYLCTSGTARVKRHYLLAAADRLRRSRVRISDSPDLPGCNSDTSQAMWPTDTPEEQACAQALQDLRVWLLAAVDCLIEACAQLFAPQVSCALQLPTCST